MKLGVPIQVLLDHPVFVGLDAAAVAGLAGGLRSQAWPVDTVIYRTGDAATEVIFLVEGAVDRFLPGAGGPILRGRIQAGDVLSPDALFGHALHSDSGLARSGTRGFAIRVEDLMAWISAWPAVGLQVALRMGDLALAQAAPAESPGTALDALIAGGTTVQVLSMAGGAPLLAVVEEIECGPDGEPLLKVRCTPEGFPRPVPGLIPYRSVARIIWEP